MSLSTIFLEHPLNPLELNLDLDERLRLYQLKHQVPNMALHSDYQAVYESCDQPIAPQSKLKQQFERFTNLCMAHLNKIIVLSLILFVFCFTTSAYVVYLEPVLYNVPNHLQELADLKSSQAVPEGCATVPEGSTAMLDSSAAVSESSTAVIEGGADGPKLSSLK